jgi:hypothetical protein
MIDLTRIEGSDRHDPRYYETCESCGGIFVEGKAPPASGKQADQIVAFFSEFAGKKSSARRPA